MGFNFKKLWEAVTPQNEEAMRRANASIKAANRTIAANPRPQGVLASPVRRQQFVQSQQPVTFDLGRATREAGAEAGNSVARSIFGNTARHFNTIKAAGQDVVPTVKVLAAQATHNPTALTNANQEVLRVRNKSLAGDSGLFGAGTALGRSQSDIENNSYGTALKKTSLNAVAGVGEVLPIVKPLKLASTMSKTGKLAANTLYGGVTNAVADAGYQYGETGKIDPKQSAIQFAAGGVLGNVTPGGKAVKAEAPNIARTVDNTPVVKAAKQVKYATDKLDPGVRELDSQYKELNTRWQTANPQGRKQLEKAIASNRQARSDATRVAVGNSMREVTDRPMDAADLGRQARKTREAFAESKIPLRAKAKDFVSQNFTDDTKYFQDLDNAAAGKRNITSRRPEAAANERLDPMIQASRNTKAMQKQRYQDIGIEDFARQFGDERKYNAYTTYRTFRTNAERAELNAKRGEDMPTAYARWTGGRDYNTDRVASNAVADEMEPLFRQENEITQKILRARGDDPSLTMSRSDAEDLIAKYPNFTPQYRTIEDDLIAFKKGSSVGSQQGKNVKELGQGSFSRPLEDPLTALRSYSDEMVQKSHDNKIIDILLRDHGEKFRPLVTKEQLIAKEDAKVAMGELGVAGKAVHKELMRNNKLSRALQSELNSLNKKGMNISLKQRSGANGDVNIKGLGGKVATSKAGTRVPLTKEEKSILGPFKNLEDIPMYESKLGPSDTRKVVESLVNMRPRELDRVLDKIARRDEKLRPLTEDIKRLSEQADDIKAAKAGVMSSGDLAAFEKSANKNTRRRVVDGYEEIYEITDPRLAQNLDQLNKHELSSAMQKLGVPTRVFKFFTTGPGNVVGFAPIALTRDVLSSILFSKAPLRSLTPQAFMDAFMAAARKGDFYKNLERRGISGTMAEADRATKEVSSDAMRNRGLKRVKVYAKSPGQMFRDAEEIDMATERFTRARLASGRYRQQLARYSKDPNLTPEQARDRAFWDAAEEFREAAINFGRSGKVTREVNAVAAYLNPAVQAGNKVRRASAESPFGFAARASLATSLLAGAVAYNRSSPDSQEIYNALDPEEKRGNIILIRPGTKVDKTTGKVTGLIKIPLPYEFRPFSIGVENMYDQSDDNAYGQLGLAGLATLTGLDTKNISSFIGQFVPTQAKPIVENVTNHSLYTGQELTPDYVRDNANGDRTEERKKSTTGSAMALSRATGGKLNPIEADNLLRGAFGGASKDILAQSDQLLKKAGKISEGEATESNAFKRLKDRYTVSFGKSEASKHFDRLATIRKGLKSDEDRKAFDSLHAKKDKDSRSLDKSAEKYQVYLGRPNVFQAERELDAQARANGEDGNPIFDLTPMQAQKVMRYRASKDLNAAKQAYDKNGTPLYTALGLDEKWYDDFKAAETAYYDKIITNSDSRQNDPLTYSGAKRPTANPALQSKIDKYYGLPKGTGARSNFLKANPDILDFWAESDQFTNAERIAMGLDPVSKEPQSGGSYGGGRGRGYARSGRGSGGGSRPSDPLKYAISLDAGGGVGKYTVKGNPLTKTYVAAKSKPKATMKIRKAKA